jgi:peptide/nickel transport system permease protein
LFAPYDPINTNISQALFDRLRAPTTAHLMGTDAIGRDVLSRVLYGGRYSLGLGAIVVVFGMLLGFAVGGLAGFFGGAVDEVLMRFADIVLAFPIVILAIAIASALGPSPVNTAIAMIAVWWPTYARVVRSQVLELREREFVLAARALGMNSLRVLRRSILPNTVGTVVILVTLDVGNAILTIAGLGFIGFGVQEPTPEWGHMIALGQQDFDSWWISFFPGLAIFTSIMGFNFFGDAVRDALDPRTR